MSAGPASTTRARGAGRLVALLVSVPAAVAGVFGGLALGEAIAPNLPEPVVELEVSADDPASLFRPGPLAARLDEISTELGGERARSIEVTPTSVVVEAALPGPGIDPAALDPESIEAAATAVAAERPRANLGALVRAEVGFRERRPGWCLQFAVDPPTQYSARIDGETLVPMPGYC